MSSVDSQLQKLDPRWKPTPQFMRHVEEHAMLLRQRVGVGPLEPVDPRSFTGELELEVAYPHQISSIPPELAESSFTVDPLQWSGSGKRMPNGWLRVLLHPAITVERERVTILEEVAHDYFGHPPSRIITLPNGITKREYNEDNEREAYGTAAAILLPSKAVAAAVWQGQSADELATAYGVSDELAEMRIKYLRLWSLYQQNLVRMRRAS